METQKRIIIVGAGFAGLTLAEDLENTGYEVYLIDRNNYHQFQPLLYQVATARLEPASISFPLRKVFQRSKNVKIRIADVLSVEADKKCLKTSIGDFSYDYLVLAYGCRTNYFGNKDLEHCAFPMKSVPEAIQLRNRILQTFEDAVITKSPEELQYILNFVIVGGGPTGVELAGALAEMKKNILPKDYPDKDFSKLTVYLLEGSPNVLNAMSDDSKKASRKYLEQLGVIVKTGTVVENYDGRTVRLKNGETIEAKNVIWAAGVTGNQIEGIPETAITRGNRLIVNRFNEIENLKDVFAIGDIAYMTTPKYVNGHPQLAAVANEQAKVLAKNFKLLAKNKPLKEYEYHDKGSMATIGKRKAVVDLPSFSFQGRFAWFTWMFVHLMLILSVKNKLTIFVNWAFSYFSNDSTLRVLIKPVTKKVDN
ncbi:MULTISPECIES: NAD(P)/FAD-dependent oxidoreductase [Flavobacterium]|uniref:NADH:ubiquinone reductase (non-electrogenic) n=1 Tax=Flavobacterium lindanitolerans TaxID=428988 RepID=A0A497UZ22_9FLAO|nr:MULTISPECIES: NAD(P)/FAD-dependent oxidoreductase [Flavobacterium]KQS46651.1 NADH dehydrogenase [Flavobacterium sp. Leaf359]MDQ7960742.1 NAD(P)/FAD-dependent oxidoreductase [Flavobacterium lindanitolerans]OJX50869.1 MAG: FAD-dependent oxidoreductase [Flavobacterium sp. 38-13]PKW28423.1 NADH dehydrogenase [Flavobacterium lindanitolerans]RLJ36072.1 NADH dehydrogenase [Flavobacterium lindanitolerans]